MISEATHDIFILAILLIIAAYFVGFTSDVKTVSDSLGGLLNIATGRNAQGQFANYPR